MPITLDHKVVKVYLDHVRPPIPKRGHDWSAQLDFGEGAPVGWGETKEEAIINLFKAISEDIL